MSTTGGTILKEIYELDTYEIWTRYLIQMVKNLSKLFYTSE